MEKKAGWQAAQRTIQGQPELTVLAVCQKVEMTPQNYYARRRARVRRTVDVNLALDLVRSWRETLPCLGGRKLYHLIEPELKKAGVKLGRDRLFAELKKAGLLVKRRRPEWPKTTQRDRNLPVFKNLVKGRKVTGRNQVWVADITYLRTKESFVYLALVTDQWSRKIVGYELSQSLHTRLSLGALNKGLRSLRKGERPIHHSDRGCQYASHEFVERARQAGLRMSMTGMNHAAENAMAERVNGILKREFWLDVSFDNYQQAQHACAHSIRLYNTVRPHGKLGMKTPSQVHQA